MKSGKTHTAVVASGSGRVSERVSVVVYPASRPGHLDGLLDSLSRLEGDALEVLVTPGVTQASAAFAPFVKRIALPLPPLEIAGDWLLEVREDWRPPDPAWLTRVLCALRAAPQVVVGRGAVRQPTWFLDASRDDTAPSYAYFLIWNAAFWKRDAARREPFVLPVLSPMERADLAQAPLAWRGQDAQPTEAALGEAGLHGLLRRAKRRFTSTPASEWPSVLIEKLRSKPLAPPRSVEAARKTSAPALSTAAAEGFLAFPRAPKPASGRFAILSQSLPPSPDSGGIGRYSNELAERLVALGAELHLITLGQGEATLERMGLFRHPVPLPQSARRFDRLPIAERNLQLSVAAYQRIVELELRGLRFDAVEAPNWDAEGFALGLASSPPLAVRVHTPRAVTMRIEGWLETPDQRRNMEFERESILHADGLLASTSGITATIGEIMGPALAAPLRFNHIPLGVNVGPAPCPTVPHEELRILFVGRLEARKGIRALLEALPDVLQRCPQAVADLVGDDTLPEAAGRPSWKEAFLARHAEAPWLARCRFHGKVSEARLAAFYRDCDLFVAPSLYESFGLVFLEAMREGKAVIGCRVGGVPEVVAHQENGLLVPPDDAKELARAMIRLCENHAERVRMGQAGRQRLVTHFDVQRTAEKTLALYRSLAEGRNYAPQGRVLLPRHDESRVSGGRIVFDESGIPAWLFDQAQPLRLSAVAGWTKLTFATGPAGGLLFIHPPQGRVRRLDLRSPVPGRRVAFFEEQSPLKNATIEIRLQGAKTARLLSVLTTPAIDWPGQLSLKEAELW